MLGTEHPDTLNSKNNLAATLRELGDLEGARRLLEKVVAARARVLGADNPDTLASKNSLDETLRAQAAQGSAGHSNNPD